MNGNKPSKPNLPNAPKPSKVFALTRLCQNRVFTNFLDLAISPLH